MRETGTGPAQWTMVDEGWGRKAVDFATLSEPLGRSGSVNLGR